MSDIERALLPHRGVHQQKIFVLHGLGGIGKTQLAIAYARKHKDRYSAILWINGNSKDTVLQSLAAFGRRAGIGEASYQEAHTIRQAPDMEAEADAILRWLNQGRNSQWLMIFDNVDRDVQAERADAQAYDIGSFLPAADHGFVLITTRLPSLGELGQTTEVTRLGSDQALELLSDRSGLHPSSNGKTDVAFYIEARND